MYKLRSTIGRDYVSTDRGLAVLVGGPVCTVTLVIVSKAILLSISPSLLYQPFPTHLGGNSH